MQWKPEDFVPGHLASVIVLACLAGVLLITLIVVLSIKTNKVGRKAKISKSYSGQYSPIQMLLFNTKFNYQLCSKESDQFYDFIKLTYICLDCRITYHFYIPKSEDYLASAKKEVNRLIKDNTLCEYTLKIIPDWEIEEYAC